MTYFLKYFVSPNFKIIWSRLCDKTVKSLENSNIIAKKRSGFKYLKQFKNYAIFHEERMNSAARHWSFGTIHHENDHTFYDKIRKNGLMNITMIDPTGKKYKEMLTFLKKESGLKNVYI